MKALVTGDDGFIGRHFRDYLTRRGWWVTGCDITRGQDCRDIFRGNGSTRYDLIVHLAATIGGRVGIEGNPIGVATDLSLDAEMFNWACLTRQPRIVYFSSSAAYPIALQTQAANSIRYPVHLPLEAGGPRRLRETDIWLDGDIGQPDYTYGWAKLTGEMLAEHARQQAGIKVSVLRPFSGYGPGQSLDYPFPSFIERAKRGADPFEVWGDGTQTRDFIHVSDVINATMAVVEAEEERPVNLCTGRATSFNTLAEMVAPGTPLYHHFDAPVGVHTRVGDPTFMREFYEPRVSLEAGIQEALQ